MFKVVGAHPASSGMMELEVLRALESRVATLERELREHQEAVCASPPLALRELKRQVDSFKNKLETTEHLSWLGEYVDGISWLGGSFGFGPPPERSLEGYRFLFALFLENRVHLNAGAFVDLVE